MQQAEIKLELFRYIDNLNLSKLEKMYNLLIFKNKKIDFWNSLNEFQKNDIEQGLEDLKNGNKRDFDEVMKEINNEI